MDRRQRAYESVHPTLPDLWYTYNEPATAEPTTVFRDRAQSRNVVDRRNEPLGLMDYLADVESDRHPGGWTPLQASANAMQDAAPPVDNRHTQAVDGFIQRLEGYQHPSRRRLIAPSSIRGEVPDMSRYYTPTQYQTEADVDRSLEEFTEIMLGRRPMGSLPPDYTQ